MSVWLAVLGHEALGSTAALHPSGPRRTAASTLGPAQRRGQTSSGLRAPGRFVPLAPVRLWVPARPLRAPPRAASLARWQGQGHAAAHPGVSRGAAPPWRTGLLGLARSRSGGDPGGHPGHGGARGIAVLVSRGEQRHQARVHPPCNRQPARPLGSWARRGCLAAPGGRARPRCPVRGLRGCRGRCPGGRAARRRSLPARVPRGSLARVLCDSWRFEPVRPRRGRPRADRHRGGRPGRPSAARARARG